MRPGCRDGCDPHSGNSRRESVRSEEERQAVFEKAAVATGRSSQVLEKDFWVCWTLHQLFSLDEKVAPLTFKGGTSLSKAFGAIQRFSEDLDITIDHGWASYATARPGTLRLRPHERMSAVLREDFEKMKSERMFDGTPPTFDEILQKLERLESEIRKVASLRK